MQYAYIPHYMCISTTILWCRLQNITKIIFDIHICGNVSFAEKQFCLFRFSTVPCVYCLYTYIYVSLSSVYVHTFEEGMQWVNLCSRHIHYHHNPSTTPNYIPKYTKTSYCLLLLFFYECMCAIKIYATSSPRRIASVLINVMFVYTYTLSHVHYNVDIKLLFQRKDVVYVHKPKILIEMFPHQEKLLYIRKMFSNYFLFKEICPKVFILILMKEKYLTV